jgi:hypothetical protein
MVDFQGSEVACSGMWRQTAQNLEQRNSISPAFKKSGLLLPEVAETARSRSRK